MYHFQFFILFFVVVSLKSFAQQGNYKFNNFGNRSILLSGNVTGSVTDIGLSYYNPARLTEIENSSFSFNAKAYQLTSLKLSNVLGEESNINDTSFSGVPSMAGGTFELYGTRFAYSFLSRSRNDFNLNYDSDILSKNILATFPDAETYKVNVNLTTKIRDDWMGLTWAKKINEKFSLGISIFGSIYDYFGGSVLSQTIKSTDNTVVFNENSIGYKQESYGIIAKIGANYHLPKMDLGLNLNLPYIELHEKGQFEYTKLIAGIGAKFDQFYNYSLKNLNSQRKEPFGVSVGAGIPIKKGKLHLNVDYVSGLSKYDRITIPDIDLGKEPKTHVLFEESRKNVINFGLGTEFYLNEKLKAYFGFSTDFSGFKDKASFLDRVEDETKDFSLEEDFYHFSLGVDWKLNWVNLILGTTYTRSSKNFMNSLSLISNFSEDSNTNISNISFERWQFVIGFEIPFLNSKLKAISN